MKKLCIASGRQFQISREELLFYNRMNVPPPTLCPVERQRRRLAHRNFRNLHKRVCDGTGNSLISMYDSSVNFPVYANTYWWSDAWDARNYGKKFDFSRSFFEQYKALKDTIPHIALMSIQSENCDYTNMCVESRNCYLTFGCVNSEDSFYSHIVWQCNSCIDCLYAYRCELCSNCTDIVDCYDLHFSRECLGCRESYFLHDCKECSNCFGCTNLRGQSYCFFNKPLSRESYFEKLKSTLPFSHDTLEDFSLQLEEQIHTRTIIPEYYGSKNENVTGNHVFESHNLHYCFDAKRSEHSKYCFTVEALENCYDISFSGNQSFCIECLTCPHSNDTMCSHLVSGCTRAHYSEFCFSSSDLLGCNGLRNASFCILNKQYTKAEYEVLFEKIKAHMRETAQWGEFFPTSLSPFGYNQSVANEYLPLTQHEVENRGLRSVQLSTFPQQPGTQSHIPVTHLRPSDDVTNQIFSCSVSGKPYKILKQEQDFYERSGLPLPHICPEQRHIQRMKHRKRRKLYNQTCSQCGNSVLSANDSSDVKSLFCRECYEHYLRN